MSDAYACDNCGARVLKDDVAAGDWLKLSRMNMLARSFRATRTADPFAGIRHFCSAECGAAWFARAASMTVSGPFELDASTPDVPADAPRSDRWRDRAPEASQPPTLSRRAPIPMPGGDRPPSRHVEHAHVEPAWMPVDAGPTPAAHVAPPAPAVDGPTTDELDAAAVRRRVEAARAQPMTQEAPASPERSASSEEQQRAGPRLSQLVSREVSQDRRREVDLDDLARDHGGREPRSFLARWRR